jgi:hypothetical protein
MPKAVWGVIGGVSAQPLNHVESPLGDGFRRLRAKLGPAGAVTAAAHKWARILCTMIKTRTAFDPAKLGHPALARLRKQAALLGFSIQPAQAAAFF